MSSGETLSASSCTERCSCCVRICILRTFSVSVYCGVLSSPFAFASSDIAMNLGKAVASWCLSCGVTFGESALAIFSNSFRVITILQSAGFFAAVLLGAAGVFPAGPGRELALVGVAGQTPMIVITAAFSGISAALGTVAGAAPFGARGGLGGACPQAIVADNTHNSQLLRIQKEPPGLVVQEARLN